VDDTLLLLPADAEDADEDADDVAVDVDDAADDDAGDDEDDITVLAVALLEDCEECAATDEEETNPPLELPLAPKSSTQLPSWQTCGTTQSPLLLHVLTQLLPCLRSSGPH